MRGRCCAGMPPARGEAEGFAGRRMRLPGLRRGAVCRFCRLSVVRHVPPHPNPLPPGRGNRSSPAIQRYRICRPGKAEPPPGVVAPVHLFPLTLTLSLQGKGTVRARPSNVIAFVGRVRRSRHPALLLRCHMFPLTLTLSLQGEGTVRARPSNVIAFVGRVRRSRHPALLLRCHMFPLTLTLSLQGEGTVRARPSNVIAFVGRVRRSRHPALLLRCHMFPLTLTLSLQ